MKRMIVVVALLMAAQASWAADSVLIQLRVSDLDRSVAFYRDTLGLRLEMRDDSLGWARIDPGVAGVTIGLGLEDDVEPASGVSINLGVHDVDAERARLESLGVAFDGETITIPGVVRLADLRDPDGHRIRLARDLSDDQASTAGDPWSWLEGRWQGEMGGKTVEEHWMATEAGMAVGMFRMADADELTVYEVLAFEREEDGSVTHRLRHFGDAMRAWEEGPVVFDLVENSDGLLALKNRGSEGPKWVRYQRTARDAMDVWIGATEQPSEKGFTLTMRRGD